MTTPDLIAELNEKANLFKGDPMWLLLKEAAERLQLLEGEYNHDFGRTSTRDLRESK